MHAIDHPWTGEAPTQPANNARNITAGELWLAKPKRLHEQHAVLAREPRHQVLLVRPQLRVPVGEADAYDVPAAQSSRLGCSAPVSRRLALGHRPYDPIQGSTDLGSVTIDAGTHTLDTARTARLLFDAELASGVVATDAALADSVLDALRVRDFPSAPWRLAQDVARKLGRLDPEAAGSASLVAARQAVLGERASAPPRFLVRVDEFPHAQAWDDPDRFGTPRYERFHEIMLRAGVPYLIAALPRVCHAPLDPIRRDSRPLDDGEVAMLGRMSKDGVAFALHGSDHRTRFASPRRRSELCGLDASATAALLDQALAELEAYDGLRSDVFVPSYNRFDAAQWPVLAARFAIVGGGPESIRCLGFHGTPQWRDGSVYLPAYPPLYGRAHEVVPAVSQAIEGASGLWIPIVLHWGWEADAGWRELERLAELLAPYTARWEDFRAAVERSR